jgi:hypothetical protein
VASSFSRLSALINDGSIKMIELQAVPRSMSTALGRCLNESAPTSVFLNEPFTQVPPARGGSQLPASTPDPWSHNDVDIAAMHVIRLVESALSSQGGPVTVLTKNIAHYLSASVLRTWIDVCSAVVWCIRDPWIQISSFVTRMANDMLFGIGSDRLKQSDLLPSHLVMVTEFLHDSPDSKDFSKTGWRAIGTHFDNCADRLPSFVADGSLFSRAPDRVLRYLCDGIGIEFSDRMIEGWREPLLSVERNYDPEITDTDDAWTRHAATSCGVETISRAPLPVSVLPPALQDHLFEVALPTYERMMRAFYSQEKLAQYRLGPDDFPERSTR